MSSVTYKNVAKKFGDQTIIKNLNIEVEDKDDQILQAAGELKRNGVKSIFFVGSKMENRE